MMFNQMSMGFIDPKTYFQGTASLKKFKNITKGMSTFIFFSQINEMTINTRSAKVSNVVFGDSCNNCRQL